MINPTVPAFLLASLLPQTTGQQSPSATPTPSAQPCAAAPGPSMPAGVKVKVPSRFQIMLQQKLAKLGAGDIVSIDPNTVIKNATKPVPCTPPTPATPPK